jgi:cytochrome c oxidase subunit 2
VQLAGGGVVTADEAYFRESILQPQAKIVSGFEPVMPTFQGLVTEEQLVQLVEYVKSLGPKPGTGPVDSGQKPAPKKSSKAGSTPANR